MANDHRRFPMTPGGEQPSAFARELVGEAAADYGRARAAVLAGVVPVSVRASALEAHDALRAAVIDYARTLRATGVPPERAVDEVKSAVEAALRLDARERRACVGSAVRWAIEGYHNA
jgi:hypothetical protein